MIQHCPCCNSPVSDTIDLEYSGLGNSIFNGHFPMRICGICGLAFNGRMHELNLEKFYSTEGFYRDLEHFDPAHPANVTRHTFFHNFIKHWLKKDAAVADIGCGTGNFVRFLHTHSGMKATGVDFEVAALNATDGEGPVFHNGSAVSLPKFSNPINMLTYFHVLEHVPDLEAACSQAYASLEEGGFLLIEVPNAERYSVVAGADAHWYAAREHVYHFTPQAIRTLLERHGFVVPVVSELITPMASFNCCSLLVLAQKPETGHVPESVSSTFLFFMEMQKKMKRRAEELERISAAYDSVVVWGLGSVFFSIMPFLYESIKDKLILVDSSPNKQKMVYKATAVNAPDFVVPSENFLCIAGSTISYESIKNAALHRGWKLQNIIPIVADMR